MDEFQGKKILITGASGFLGRYLLKELYKRGAEPALIQTFDHSRYDLLERHDVRMLGCEKRDYIFHLAGYNGNIQFNLSDGADIFFRSTVMGLNLLDWAKDKGAKVISCVTSCAYPEKGYDVDGSTYSIEICKEDNFVNGPCNQTVACHGYAKRNLQFATQLFNRQYGLNAVTVCPTTLYGPYDSFDPKKTKVMGGLIKRFVDAQIQGLPDVTLWGTGKPMREFLYVTDAAEMIVDAALKYNDSNLPLNLGSGHELSIKDLAENIKCAANYFGEIKWDTSKQDGQYRKRLDLTRMSKVLGPRSFVPLYTGIKQTVEYYRSIA